MRKVASLWIPVCFFLLAAPAAALAHCEIPCGIYDDEARFSLMGEQITTIEKSMKQILELQANPGANANQLVRWVMNKEEHATRLQHTISQYFLTQRIKVGTEDYEKKLVLLHKMLVEAMKCKQTTDLSHVKALRNLLDDFRNLYLKR